MVNELRTLLQESAADNPPEPFDTGALLGAGRARVRQRRHRVMGGVGVAAAAVVAAGALWPGLLDPADRLLPASPSEVTTQQFGKADPAREGTDFDLVRDYQVTGHEDPQVLVVTDEGDWLIREFRKDGDWVSRLPASGRPTVPIARLPESTGAVYPLDQTADRIRLLGFTSDRRGDPGRFRPNLLTLDLATGTWDRMTWRGGEVQPANAALSADGRIQLQVFTDADLSQDYPALAPMSLISLSTTDPADVDAPSPADVPQLGLDSARATWVEGDSVTVRDLATGEETSWQPDGTCEPSGATPAGDYVLVNCMDEAAVEIVTPQGEAVARLDAPILTATGEGDRLVLTVIGGATSGVYLYDVSEERLLLLDDRPPWFRTEPLLPEGQFAWSVSGDPDDPRSHGGTAHMVATWTD